MSRIEQLYQEMILDHNRNPRNHKVIDPHSHHSHGINPLCGDDYHVYIHVENGTVQDISFYGTGCAISKSSGSLMTSALKGKTSEEVTQLKNEFIKLLTENNGEADKEKLGKLRVFEGVKKFPIRVKCATLVWRALENALETDPSTIKEISTE